MDSNKKRFFKEISISQQSLFKKFTVKLVCIIHVLGTVVDWEVPLLGNTGKPYIGLVSHECVILQGSRMKESPCAVSSSNRRRVVCDFH